MAPRNDEETMISTEKLDVMEAGGLASSATDERFVDGDTTKSTPLSKPFPRLVQRNLPFFQSKNKVSVIHNKGVQIVPLLRYDWFHVFLRWPMKYIQ